MKLSDFKEFWNKNWCGTAIMGFLAILIVVAIVCL